MRQYYIFYKRLGSPAFSKLEPGSHAKLYDRAEINAAIEHMRGTPCVTGMVIQYDGELFNIVAFEQEAHAPHAFKFPEPLALNVEGIIIDKPAEGESVPKTNA
jgi:hypothetical protein